MYFQSERAKVKLETANKERASRRANQLMLDKLAKKAQLKKDANDKDMKNDADYNPLDDEDDSQDSVISDITAYAREVSKTLKVGPLYWDFEVRRSLLS